MREVTVNLHRGFLSLARQIAARLPHGLDLWDALLRDLTTRGLKRTLPEGEIPLIDLPERLHQHHRIVQRRARRVR